MGMWLHVGSGATSRAPPSARGGEALALRMARLFGVGVPELFIDHWEPEA
jgi:hypothetical protein